MFTAQKINAEPGDKPPINTKRIYRWADLPDTTAPAVFIVQDDGEEVPKFTVSRHMRQVLEGLMHGPIFAASYCRLSDQVLPLRRDKGLKVICTFYRDDPETGPKTYGVYHLASDVRRVDGEVRY